MTFSKAFLALSAAALFTFAPLQAHPHSKGELKHSEASKEADAKNTDSKSTDSSSSEGKDVSHDEEIKLPKELEPVAVKASEDDLKKFEAMLENVMKSEKGLEIMQKLQMRAQFTEVKDEQQTRKLLDKHKNDLMNEDNAIILGNPKGTVNLVLVADPLCQNCRTLMSILSKVAKQQPSLKVIVHQWAFVNPEESARVAKLLQAAYSTDAKSYNKLHEAFLALKEVPNDAMMKTLINGAKYDFDKVADAAKSEDAQKLIESTRNLAKELKFPGAPILMLQNPEKHLMLVPPVSAEELSKIVSDLSKAMAGGAPTMKDVKAPKAAAAA